MMKMKNMMTDVKIKYQNKERYYDMISDSKGETYLYDMTTLSVLTCVLKKLTITVALKIYLTEYTSMLKF
jgi:hypothetical protein